MQAVMDYIRQKEPEWRKLYFKNEALDNNSRIQPITERQKEEAEALARQIRPEMPNMFTDNLTGNVENSKGFSDYFMDNVADIGYGAKKALSGATFGASDWALRKLGLDNEQEYLRHKRAEGLGGLTKGLGLASEIGGNILGAGGALIKGLQNAGLKGLKLATSAGGVEGAAYDFTGSDRLADTPENMAWALV